MAGTKNKSGGARPNSGPKSKGLVPVAFRVLATQKEWLVKQENQNETIRRLIQAEIDNYQTKATMKPSDISSIEPFSSVFYKSECETVAQSIIIILKRTGNEWRKMEYEEYKTERLKDGGFSEREKAYFDQVVGYTVSADTARLFSPQWNIQTEQN